MSTRKPNTRRADLDDPPAIREIRAVRRTLPRQAGGTVEGYFRLTSEMAARARTTSPAPIRAGKKRNKAT